MEVSREEMLEFAKMATFHLDDRLVPFDRETLRAEAWLLGHEMSKRFPLVNTDQKEVEIVLDGVRHRLITNPDIEDCKYCSLDKVCDRFKDAICNVFKGQSGCHIFQKVGEE